MMEGRRQAMERSFEETRYWDAGLDGALSSLEPASGGRRPSWGRGEVPGGRFFGWSDPGEVLTGNFFLHRVIDDRHTAFLTVDVKVPGVAPALGALQLATLFLDNCDRWAGRPGDPDLEPGALALRMNHRIHADPIPGGPIAVFIGLLDGTTGRLRYCAPGWTPPVVVRDSDRRPEVVTVPPSPPLGPLAAWSVEEHFRTRFLDLGPGDTLVLWNEALESSLRAYRDDRNHPVRIDPPPAAGGWIDGEELGADPRRLVDLLTAVARRESFILAKDHAPAEMARAVLDFSGPGDRVETLILALAALERLWRLVPGPRNRSVVLDSTLRTFLGETLVGFDRWFTGFPTPELHRPGREAWASLDEDRAGDGLLLWGLGWDGRPVPDADLEDLDSLEPA